MFSHDYFQPSNSHFKCRTFSENDYSLCSLAVMHKKPLSRFSCRSALASFDCVGIVGSGPYENGYMTIHLSEIITSQRFPSNRKWFDMIMKVSITSTFLLRYAFLDAY